MVNKMADNSQLSVFQNFLIRRVWHNGEWYFSILDTIRVLTNSKHPGTYWAKLKVRVTNEGFIDLKSEIVVQKLPSPDGKLRETETANLQILLRLIQSVPSPKAEPFKAWLAQVGRERIEEVEDPGKAIERMRAAYKAKGYNDTWIDQRLRTDGIRNELTDEWRDRGAHEGIEYSILTNDIHQGVFELTVQAHKDYKILPVKANLRDNMSVLELALLSVGEATAIELHRDRDSTGFRELQRDAKDAGETGREARKVVEKRLGRSVVTSDNHLTAKPKAPKKLSSRIKDNSIQTSLFDLYPEESEDKST